MLDIEQAILLSNTAIPVYVMNWSPEVKTLMDDLVDSKIIDENASSAAKGTYKSIAMYCKYVQLKIKHYTPHCIL